MDELLALGLVGCGDRSATFIEQYQITKKPSPQQETVCEIPKVIADPNPNKKGNRAVDQWSHVDYVTTNAHSSEGASQLNIVEDNDAVIKMIIKGRSPTMRHVSRTHRGALDRLFDRTKLEPKIKFNWLTPKPNSQIC